MNDMTDTLRKARSQMEATLIEKAAADGNFRALLTSDPHAAIRAAFGTDPIPSLKLSVIEEAPGEVVLVLPRAIAEDELPDDLLDLASGGADMPEWKKFANDCIPGARFR